MLLSKNSIKNEINENNIIKSSSDSATAMVLDKNIKPASIDLTIGAIIEPEDGATIGKLAELQNKRKDHVELMPGAAVLVEVYENLKFSRDIAGLVFPPNRLAKEGLIMTNPGHIDPGFEGIITFCLVNIGKKSKILNAGEAIARLLVMRVEAPSDTYDGKMGAGVDLSQLSHMGRDFANIEERTEKQISKYFTKKTSLIIALAALIIGTPAILGLFIPQYGTLRSADSLILESVEKRELLEEIKLLKELVVKVCQSTPEAKCIELDKDGE